MGFLEDLEREKEWELHIAQLLGGDMSEIRAHDVNVKMAIEVKHDYKWHETGNIAVEITCSGKPSGISIGTGFVFYILTKSGEEPQIWWASKNMVRNYLRTNHAGIRRCMGGDGKRVDMFLFPLAIFKKVFKPFSDW